MNRRSLLLRFFACCTLLAVATAAQAAVAIIANRGSATVAFSVAQIGTPPRNVRLAAGDSLTLPLAGSCRLTLQTDKQNRAYTLSPDTAYALVDRAGSVTLTAIGLSEGSAVPPLLLPAFDWNVADQDRIDAAMMPGPVVVPVRLLVDEDERASRPAWEKRLRTRIAEASEILARDCGVSLQVVDYGTWESDNEIHDFPKSLAEFERRVAIKSERLAIGFTSQYALIRGSTHLGGIRGPLASHLLVREWSNVMTEPERLEVLLHELGHFFGAAHSPEPTSVMRPSLADRRARSAKFRIGLDPLNTLAASIVGDQLRADADRHSLSQLDLSAQMLLRPIYAELSRAAPDDPNPRRYVGLIDDGGVERTARAGRAVVEAIGTNAHRISSTLLQTNAAAPTPQDILDSTEWRLRAAAKLALDLPPELQTTSCLLAVSLTGPERESLASHPLARPVCQRILEPSNAAQAGAAQPAAGEPAAAGNLAGAVSDIPAAHGDQFRLERLLAAAALASLVGSTQAEAAALITTGIADPAAKSVDLEAYLDCCAGICLAARLQQGHRQLTLARIAEEKDGARLLPVLAGELKSVSRALPRDHFERLYGSAMDERFTALRSKLCEKIAAQPSLR